ncbi:YdeI/OmpD-associated family protein [Nannocystis bainbridge]|uniref:YdeI/OmpD-associated family protein n=1 Tax=Nannocystis bainbridge TaxID=2995303 RepID=A0ABT5E694_9BACT|nr:YdeI/OmpD-associated family protein [Nannocystis bainbridge]MDC0720286.1 YdeI/OmpD-associated family protein [Nannocystis bainbridge]
MAAPTLPIVLFADADAFSRWLAEHHRSSPGAWLQLAKKGKSLRSVSYSDAVDVALVWGWIDSQKKAHDGDSWLQRFTPRGPRSLWSQINRERVQALVERGAMQPAGLAEVERARADGRWDAAYAPASRIEVPAELTAALARVPAAQAAFAGLDAANRYALLFRLQTAKKPETRARQVERFVEMLAKGRKIHE